MLVCFLLLVDEYYRRIIWTLGQILGQIILYFISAKMFCFAQLFVVELGLTINIKHLLSSYIWITYEIKTNCLFEKSWCFMK